MSKKCHYPKITERNSRLNFSSKWTKRGVGPIVTLFTPAFGIFGGRSSFFDNEWLFSLGTFRVYRFVGNLQQGLPNRYDVNTLFLLQPRILEMPFRCLVSSFKIFPFPKFEVAAKIKCSHHISLGHLGPWSPKFFLNPNYHTS